MLKTKSMLLATFAVGLYGASAVADMHSDTRAETGAQTQPGAHSGMKHETKAMTHAVRKASELMGKTVRNQQGEELGQIEDFALDLQQGRLNYVVVSTGGMLEQRLVGISTNELQAGPDDAFIANVSQQQIEQAQELPDENWPAQPTIGQAGTEFAPLEGQRTQSQNPQTGGQHLSPVHKASELMGKTVRDQQGEDVGKIEDFAVDMQQGELNYVVINTGGFMSQRLVGIAANDLRAAPDGDAFIVNKTQQQLESAQELPSENWPAQPTVGSTAGQRQGETTATAHGVKKASDLMGKTVRDSQGEDLGEIEDFALDLQQGRLNYVVLSTGGMLQQRLVGISAGELRMAPNDDAFIANVSQQQIEQAQELPDENWPAQPTVGQARTEFAPFEGQGTHGGATGTQGQMDHGQTGAQTGTQTGAQPGAQPGQTRAQTGMDQQRGQNLLGVQKASELMGKTVRDQQGEDLGTIEDFALDMQQGQLNYVVIDTGGFLSQRLIGIAANELRAAPDADAFIANVTQQQLEAAQELPDENWPAQPTIGSTGAQQREGEFAPFEGDRQRDQQQQRDTDWQQDQQRSGQY
jgi:sporulation protein YlmC with PRC-barrel domain